MTKAKILTILCALFPTYCALFVKDGIASAVVMGFSTLVFVVVTASSDDNITRKDMDIKGKIQLGWILHIVGMLVVIAQKNIF
jgi:uncharacterized membrane protein YGL010W